MRFRKRQKMAPALECEVGNAGAYIVLSDSSASVAEETKQLCLHSMRRARRDPTINGIQALRRHARMITKTRSACR